MTDTGQRFGKYLLIERIGVGGMAEVFKAKAFGAEGFERLVAIKRILPHLTQDHDFAKMFVDEAKIAVRLSHPNIVAIHDLGRADGTLYIAMEYVPGRDLRAVYDFEQQRKGITPIGIACHVLMKMCEALHHAHFATTPEGEPLQVIHRDVSPQNVLLSFDGEVKVADFGLAKARGRMVQTQAGVVKGKLAYMSPEQLRGDEIDHRVDVFGLGIVLFELVTGKRLFLGPSDVDTLKAVYTANVPSMRELNPEVHPELEAIVRKALSKDRAGRHATALELHDEIQSFAYAHGAYCGASTLRSYLREGFPDAAPSEADAPPFAPSAPPPPPTATLRPPARSSASPSADPDKPNKVPSIAPRVVGAERASDRVAMPPPSPTGAERASGVRPAQASPASKRPSPAVVAHRVISTGGERDSTPPRTSARPDSAPPWSSGVQTDSSPPWSSSAHTDSTPPRQSGVHGDSAPPRHSTVQPVTAPYPRPSAADGAPVHLEASGTNGAAWDDDETTELGSVPEVDAAEHGKAWDDRTQIANDDET